MKQVTDRFEPLYFDPIWHEIGLEIRDAVLAAWGEAPPTLDEEGVRQTREAILRWFSEACRTVRDPDRADALFNIGKNWGLLDRRIDYIAGGGGGNEANL